MEPGEFDRPKENNEQKLVSFRRTVEQPVLAKAVTQGEDSLRQAEPLVGRNTGL